MRTLSLVLAATLLFAAVPGCGDTSEEVQQIQDGLAQTWDGMKKWSVKNRDQAKQWFEENRPALEAQFEAAKQKAGEVSDDASAAVEAKWKDLSQKLADLEQAGEGEWEKARDAAAKAYEAFRLEMRQAERRRAEEESQ